MEINSKKILENGNETIALRDQISKAIIEKSAVLSLNCDNENKELKKTTNMMEEAIEKIKEEMNSLQDKNEESTKEYLECRDKMNQEITFLKDEIVPAFLSKDWKVQKRNVKLYFLLKL